MGVMILAVKYFQAAIKGHPKAEQGLHPRWVTLSAHHPLSCLCCKGGKLQGKEHLEFCAVQGVCVMH